MPHFDQCCGLSFELFHQIVNSNVIVRKPQLFDCDIVFFISRFENIRTATSSDLLFEMDITDIYSEVILSSLELLVEDLVRLLRLSQFRLVDDC